MSAITQAFVLGAGLGTRLRPLTDDVPKPLVPIFQKPLITFAFDHLIDIGITKFFVNTHHRADRFGETFPGSTYRDRPLQFFHEPDLLETAGGIANIAPSIARGPLLIYNGDILTDLPLAPLIEHHLCEKNLVTLALRSNAEPKHIALDSKSGRIVDINNQLSSGAEHGFVFTGVYIVDPEFVDLLERGVKRSVIPHFLDLIRREEKIGGVVLDQGHWWDVGNREAYLKLHRELSGNDGFPAVGLTMTAGKPSLLGFPAFPVDPSDWRLAIHPTATVDPTAQLRGCSVLGRDCQLGPGAILDDSVVWPGSQIASRTELTNCIVRTRQKVSGTHRNIDI